MAVQKIKHRRSKSTFSTNTSHSF